MSAKDLSVARTAAFSSVIISRNDRLATVLLRGVDQGIGEQVTPFRGADRKDRQLALPAQIPHAIGVIALSLTPQPRHTLSWNACKQVRGKIEPLKIFQSIEQAIGGG